MTLERITVKKSYYYVVCAITLFVLMWGTIDVVSSIISFVAFKPQELQIESPTSPKGGLPSDVKGGGEPFIDEYYQSRMLFDRLGDSLARILVSGAIFAYFSYKLRLMEKTEI